MQNGVMLHVNAVREHLLGMKVKDAHGYEGIARELVIHLDEDDVLLEVEYTDERLTHAPGTRPPRVHRDVRGFSIVDFKTRKAGQ